MKICPVCGKANEDGFKFCVGCGTPLGADPAPEETDAVPAAAEPETETPAAEAIKAPPAETAADASAETEPEPEAPAEPEAVLVEVPLMPDADLFAGQLSDAESGEPAAPVFDAEVPVSAEDAAPEETDPFPLPPPVAQETPPKRKRVSRARILIPILAGAVVLVGAVVFLSILFSPVSRVSRALDSGDYAAAGETFRKSVSGNEKGEASVAEKVDLIVADLVEGFDDGTMEYSEVWQTLEALRMHGLPSDTLDGARVHVSALHASRESWIAAQKAFGARDYEATVAACDGVIREDEDYAEAQETKQKALELWMESILNEASARMEENDYEAARAVLAQHEDRFGAEAEYRAAIETCEADALAYAISQEIASARGILYGGEFETAFAYLDQVVETYGETDALREARAEMEADLSKIVREMAEGYYNVDSVDRAMAVLERGLALVPEDEEMAGLLAQYRASIPVILAETEPESFTGATEGSALHTSQYLTDNTGNTYTTSVYANNGEAVYALGGQYASFTGTVAFPAGVSTGEERASARLDIYGDGDLLFTSEEMDETALPVFFELNVSGYEKLTLVWTCTGTDEGLDWGGFATLFDGALRLAYEE